MLTVKPQPFVGGSTSGSTSIAADLCSPITSEEQSIAQAIADDRSDAEREPLVTCPISLDDDQLNLFGDKVLGFNKIRIPHTEDHPTLDLDPLLVNRKELEPWQRDYLYEYERS
jgi:hypothetical protein